MDDQRSAQKCGHQSARHGDIAAHAQHDIGTVAENCYRALAQGTQQRERQRQQAQQPFAAHAGEIHPGHRVAVFGHQFGFHAVGRTQPHHVPALRAQCISNRQPRVDVPAGAACHDQDGAVHIGKPLATLRFS